MKREPVTPADPASLGREEAQELLRNHWGHAQFRPGQWEVIEAVLSGRDALAVLPTGTGKSVCYQVPAIITPGLTLVVSPLIALMRDQVQGLGRRGIPATFIDSTLSSREIDQRLTDAEYGKYRMLYIAPERLGSETFKARAQRFNVPTVVVDEAHCVSEWGHSFRPSYLGIPEAVQLLGRPVVVALTATATPHVRSDIKSLVGLRNPKSIVTGFDRPNIDWVVRHDDNKRRRVLSILRGGNGSAVLYVGTRRGAEEWDAWLRSRDVNSVHYHGGLQSAARERAQGEWMRGDARVIVATSAFGMGIDKPDVRHVIHVDLPLSLEAYYQEAGRAGRDGQPSTAVLLFRDGDERLPTALIDASYPTAEQVSRIYDALCSVAQVAVGTRPEGPVDVALEEVARLAGVKAAVVRQAVDHLERMGAWVSMPEGEFGYLRLLTSPESMREFIDEDRPDAIRRLVEHLLRGGGADAYHAWVRVLPSKLAHRLDVTPQRLEQALQHLTMAGHLRWRGPGATLRIVFLEARRGHAPAGAEGLKKSRQSAHRRLDDLMRYAAHRGCRRNYILTYFGEKSPAQCGRCDNCRGENRRAGASIDSTIIHAVLAAVDAGADPFDRALNSGWSTDEVDACVDWLTGEGCLRVRSAPEFALEITDRGREMM